MKPSRSAAVRRRMRGGAYLLPSLLTTCNLLFGFHAVILGLQGNFQRAAVFVFVAALLDGLDGAIARLTGTESEFGRQYDSLVDLVTFGLAPAMLAYLWGTAELGRLGWLIPFFYLAAMAARLARFNVQTRPVDSRDFVGLPAPAAAGAICSILFVAPDREWRTWALWAVVGALGLIALLMVSTFRYRSFKRFDLRRRWSYRNLLLVVGVVTVAAYRPAACFLVVATLYAISGPAAWLGGRIRSTTGDPTTKLSESEP